MRIHLCLLVAVAAAALTVGALGPARAGRAGEKLPRFTEEREAAALHFVKKHLTELLPLLDQLKKKSAEHYQREIREIFQVTELLAELSDDAQRHDLELKVWIAENRAQVLLTKLATPNEEERKKINVHLLDVAKQLIGLDLEILELRAERLDRELGEVKDEAQRIRDNREKYTKDRHDTLLKRLQNRAAQK